MVSISFTKFRQHAKTYFDAVEKGEKVRILRHGKVIAEIMPPTNQQPKWRKAAPQLVIPGLSLSRAVLEERRKSRS